MLGREGEAREGGWSKRGTPEHGKRSRSDGGWLGQGYDGQGQRRSANRDKEEHWLGLLPQWSRRRAGGADGR